MVDSDLRVNEWAEAHGGLRGSTLLRAGAVLAALSLLVDTSCRMLVPNLEAGPLLVVTGAWLGWIAALAVLGLGFLWTGMNQVLTRYGLVVGIFHLLHAAFLLLRIFTDLPLAIPPRALVVGRLSLLLLFALQERKDLEPQGSRLLLIAAALALAKAVAAAWGFPPELGRVGNALWHFFPSLLLVLALYHTGDLVRRREDEWAEGCLAEDRGTGFEDFNNPLNPRHGPDG